MRQLALHLVVLLGQCLLGLLGGGADGEELPPGCQRLFLVRGCSFLRSRQLRLQLRQLLLLGFDALLRCLQCRQQVCFQALWACNLPWAFLPQGISSIFDKNTKTSMGLLLSKQLDMDRNRCISPRPPNALVTGWNSSACMHV